MPRSTIVARAAILLTALALSVFVARAGVATWLSRSDPRAAAQIAPGDARLALAAAQASVEAGATVQAPQVRRWAEVALSRDPTLVGAVEYRALQAETDGDRRRAGRLLELSSAISRRSLPTRLWLIQRSVERGDVAAALEDFDLALRTSSAAPDVLFPVLTRAVGDPTLVLPVARLLDRNSDWRAAFLHYATTQAHAGSAVGAVVLAMRNRNAVLDGDLDRTLVGELVAEHDFALARQIQDRFRPRVASTDLVRDGSFSDPTALPPFGWTLISKGDLGAERSGGNGRSGLIFRASPGAAGPVATQLLTLPGGAYRLSVKAGADLIDREARPYWTLSCADAAGGQIALLDAPDRAGGTAAIDLVVPTACSGQWLALNLRPSDAPNQAGAVAAVAIVRR